MAERAAKELVEIYAARELTQGYSFKQNREMMKESIKRLKEKLDQSSTGHLPLSLRVDLMKQIGDILSAKNPVRVL